MPFNQPETTKLQHQLPKTTSHARQPQSGALSESSDSVSGSEMDRGAISCSSGILSPDAGIGVRGCMLGTVNFKSSSILLNAISSCGSFKMVNM